MDEPLLKRLKCAAKDKDDADDAATDKAEKLRMTKQPGKCISNDELLAKAKLALAKSSGDSNQSGEFIGEEGLGAAGHAVGATDPSMPMSCLRKADGEGCYS